MKHLVLILAITIYSVLSISGCTMVARKAQTGQANSQADNPLTSAMMLHRAADDYSGIEKALPTSVEQLLAEGYLPYSMPGSTTIGFEVVDSANGKGVVTSDGVDCYNAAGSVGPVEAEVMVPMSDFVSKEVHRFVQDGSNLESESETAKIATWEGAKWVEQGQSSGAIRTAMRTERLRLFLVFNADDIIEATGSPPSDMATLETYIGLQKSEEGWNGITMVPSLEEVSESPGNLFVGWDSGTFSIAANLGIETRQCSWKALPDGGYKRTPAHLYY